MASNNIKNSFFIVMIVLLMLSSVSVSWAGGDPVVIVNKNNPISSINKNDLSNIFLGKKQLWDNGNRIQPGLLSTDNPEIKMFLKGFCHKTPRRFNAHWMKHVFSGSGTRPVEFSSANSAVQFILSNKDAIAIIDTPNISNKVKRIEITGLEEKGR